MLKIGSLYKKKQKVIEPGKLHTTTYADLTVYNLAVGVPFLLIDKRAVITRMTGEIEWEHKFYYADKIVTVVLTDSNIIEVMEEVQC